MIKPTVLDKYNASPLISGTQSKGQNTKQKEKKK